MSLVIHLKHQGPMTNPPHRERTPGTARFFNSRTAMPQADAPKHIFRKWREWIFGLNRKADATPPARCAQTHPQPGMLPGLGFTWNDFGDNLKMRHSKKSTTRT